MSKLFDYAMDLEQQGKLDDALNYYEMAIDEKGCPFDIRCYIGRTLNKMGNYSEALDCFDLVLTMDENHLESIAFCCISTGVFHFPNHRAVFTVVCVGNSVYKGKDIKRLG